MTYNPRLKGSVITAGATSSELPSRLNSSGVSLNRTDPVRLDNNGEVQKVDPSIQSQVLSCIGVAKDSVSNGSQVGIVTGGRVENVTTPGSVGDAMYLSKTGGLTNMQPSASANGFVTGDFVLSIGILVKNQTNPLLTDLLVNIRLVGQL